MIIKISCSVDELPRVVEFYTEQGFTLQKKLHLGSEIDLWFHCEDKSNGYRAISEYGAEGFLEFEDGTVSPLYVRNPINFAD